MNGEVRHRLDLAQLDARRRRHAETEPAHLLAVILDIKTEAEALHARGLDPSELRERTEAHFAERPAVGGYRDGSSSPPSVALERVLRRIAGNRWLPLVGKMRMIDALLLEPSVAELVFALRQGEDSRYLVERARALAIMLNHPTIGLEHVVRALLNLPSFVETLGRAKGDVERLRAALTRALPPFGAALTAPSATATSLRRVLYTGKFPDADSAPMTIRQLCIALAREDDCERFWEAAGITRAGFLLALHVPA